MSDHYSNADVQAMRDVALSFGVYSGSDQIFKAMLDRITPAIAARALREFADWAEGSDLDEYPFDGLDDTVKTIRARANEIGAQP